MQDYQRYLDPKVLNKLSGLEIKARLIVEGFIWGLHKSPYKGYSVEFAEHREYSPGDDIRHLDWKVYGKTDRLYLKQYEQETNLSAYILLDTSESMKYASGAVSKFEYASYIAASLSYLILKQQDAVGLFCFDREVVKTLQPSTNRAHIHAVAKTISEARNEHKTDMSSTMNSISNMIKKRGLIIIISDLFDRAEKVLSGIQRLKHDKHDVIVIQVVDKEEMSFSFRRMTKFVGLENLPEALVDPVALRKQYIHEFNDFVTAIRRGCLSQKVDFVQLTTDQPLDVALTAFLATRQGRR